MVWRSVIRWGEEGGPPSQGGFLPGEAGPPAGREVRDRIDGGSTPAVRRSRSSLFVGQYEHSLDSKGRVVLPAPFRAFVAERGYVTQLDGCIGMWSAEGFPEVAERWKSELDNGSITAGIFRKLMGRVQDVKLDAAGRITLPRELLDALGFDDRVVVAGRYDRAEIWPLERFEQEVTADDDAEFTDVIRRLGI